MMIWILKENNYVNTSSFNQNLSYWNVSNVYSIGSGFEWDDSFYPIWGTTGNTPPSSSTNLVPVYYLLW